MKTSNSILGIIAVLFAAITAHGATITWTNSAGGNWSRTNNWSPNRVPGSSDTAVITNAGNYTVTLDVSGTVAGLVVGATSGVTTQTFLINGQTFTLNGQATVNSQGLFNFINGNLAGAPVLGGALNWSGGSIAAGSTLAISTNGVLNLSGNSTLNLYGVLANAGTVNWSGAAVLDVCNSANCGNTGGIVNMAGAVFHVQSDQPINNITCNYQANGYFSNAGTFIKSAGTNTAINLPFNNTGTVDVQSGTVSVNAGGSGSGQFIAEAGATLAFPNSYTASSGSVFGGAGTNLLSGGTFTVNGNITTSNLTLAGATLTGNVTLRGLFTWTSGYLWSGASLTVASNAVLNLSGSSTLNLYGVLTNAGTVNWTGLAVLAVCNSGSCGDNGGVVNLAGAVFNVQSDQPINNITCSYEANGYFNNAGLLRKSSTTGTTTINVVFNNNGTVEVDSGTLAVNGGGAGTGTFNVAGGAGVSFGNNNSGTAFAGAGTCTVNSGTLTLNGVAQNIVLSGGVINGFSGSSISNLTWISGALQGANVVTGISSWTGGSIAAGSTLTIASNAVLNLSGSSTLNLYGVLTNAGTVNWTGTSVVAVCNSASCGDTGGIVNLAGAVFNVQSDQPINNITCNYAANGYFNNAGLLRKSSTTGTTTINVAFNNTGTVDVQSGTVSANNGGSGSGQFTAEAGTTLAFPNNYSLGTNAVLSGAGTNLLNGGTFTANGMITTSNLFLAGATLAGNATISGTVSFNWTNANLTAGASLTVATNGVLNLVGASTLNLYGVLTNAGTVNWTGLAVLAVYNSGNCGYNGGIVNLAGAVFNVQNDQPISNVGCGYQASGYFNNAGLFRKSPTTGTTTINVTFNNTGTVDVQSGTVVLNGGETGNGTFLAEAGATLNFPAGYTGNSGAVFVGAGTNLLSGGTFTVNGSITTSNLVLAGATLNANIAVAGLFTWTSGSLGTGSTLTIMSNAVLNLSGSSTLYLYGSLTNAGTVNWTGTGNLQIGYGPYGWVGWIANLAGAVFNVENDQTIVASDGSFNNAGLLRKSATSGSTTIGVPLNNAGTVEVDSGMVAVQSQYTGSSGVLNFALNGINTYGRMSFANSLALPTIGTLQVHTGNGYLPSPGDGFSLFTYPSATGNFTNFNLPPPAQWQSIVNPTTYNLVALNSEAITNAYTWTGLVNSNWSNPSNWNPIGVPTGQVGQVITLSNGTLNLSSPITINGQFNWLGGALTGNPLTIATNGALSIGSSNVKILQTALTNAGTAIWGGGNLVLSNCATTAGSIVNSSGALWDICCDQSMSSSCANTNSFWANTGTVLKSYSAGTTTISVPFYDTGGTLGMLQGALAFNAPVSFNGGSLSGNGVVAFNAGVQNNQALSVTGITMTLGGAWVNAGSINATNAAINLSGTFTLSTLGILNTSEANDYLTGTFNNTGTAFLLGSSVGSWILNGGTIDGGTVNSTNGTSLLVGSSGGTLNGVTVNGTLDVGNSYYNGSGVVLNVLNGLTLNGTALVGNPTNSNFGALNFVGSQTLGGNASVTFGEAPNSADNALCLANASSTLTIASGIAIEGQNGTIGYSSQYGGSQSVSVINNGTISGNVTPGTINIAAQGYTQQGILSVSSGNVVNVKGSIFLTGLGLFTIQSGGTIQVTGNVSGNTVNSGEFSASGTLILNGSGTGSAPQFFEVMGQDLGTSGVGFIHNFTYGTIILANNTYVRLINQYQNYSDSGAEALYVNSLIIPSGTTLDLNGFHVYVRAFQGGGTMLNGTVTQVPNSGPIGLGAPSLGSLATAGQLDQWTFFARAGQFYTVLVDPGSDTGVAPYLDYVQAQVVNTNAAVIASATNASSGAPVLLSGIAITNDGTYGVQIHAPPLVPGSTGHYNVTVWQTTPNVGSIVLNQIVNGDIETPYSLDQWNFAAAAGQQIRFHLVNTSGPGLGFSLSGPNGPLGFTNVITDSAFVTLPLSGNYSVTVHSLAGQYGIEYAFELYQTIQTNQTFGTTYQGQWAGSGQAVLLQYNLSASSPLQVVLNNLVTNNHAVVYVQLGQPPTPTSYSYSATATGPNQQLLIPVAAAGTWYVLVYGDNIQTPGAYTVTASSYSVILNSLTPNISGLNQPFTITLAGAGFDSSSSVQFIDSSNHVYQASSFSVDAYTQITLNESAGILAPGFYSVRVSEASGNSATLTNAFQVLTYGIPNLVTSLSLPSRMGYHIPATVYPNYGNNGGAAMAAPLLVLTANQQGVQGALMTLNNSLVAQGLWTSAEPLGFSHTVQFLGSGQTPGLLQPGESFQMPVYYAGWQQPWNFSYPYFTWNLGVIQTTDTTPVDWASLESSLQPANMPADAWNAVFSAFTNEVGSTWGAYVSMLDNNSYYLGRLGLNVTDINKLLAFQFMQADGLCPLRTLASSVDASVPTPGLPLTFSRFFGERIAQRYAFGRLGRGWSDNWQYSLQQGSDGTVTIFGPGGSQRIFQPNTQSGGYWAQAGDYGTLASAGNGAFTLTEKSGLVYYYAANGTLSYVQDLNGNTITLGYTGALLTSLTHSSGQYIQVACNGAGLIQTLTDNFGHQTILTYDAQNQHLAGAQYFDGRTATYTYNTTGAPEQLHVLTGVASSCCHWRYFNYDVYGRLTNTYLANDAEELTFSYGASLQMQPLIGNGAALTFSGGEVTVTDGLGNPSQFYFDNNGMLAKAVDALGNAIHLGFDSNYNLTSISDPAGRSYSYSYDINGNVIESTDPLGNSSQFNYTKAYNRLASVTDGKGNPTHYTYDPYGNLESITYADGSVESWSYDAFGSPETWNNRRDHQTFYTYNNTGQVTGKYFADGSATLYSYDAKANLTNTTTYDIYLNPLQSVGMTFDASNHLTQINYPGGKYLSFAYDSEGRRISSVDQLGHTLLYAYDSAGRLEYMTNELNALVVSYQYDSVGHIIFKTLGNDLFTTYRYDPAGRVLGLTNFLSNGTVISCFNYAYDNRGRRTAIGTQDGNWTYGYDDLGQLLSAVYVPTTTNVSFQNLTYVYDPVGNRTLSIENGITNSYAANNLNEYFSVGHTNYAFDPDGNLIKELSPQGTNTYTYSDDNRLISVTRSQETSTYSYDGLGDLVGETVNGVNTEFVIDPANMGNLVGQYTSNGVLIAQYQFAVGLLSRIDGGVNPSFYAFDAVGNTHQLVNQSGNLTGNYEYDPFGTQIEFSESVSNQFGFAGEFGVTKDTAGLLMRSRSYDSALGQFMSEDQVLISDDLLNVRRYSQNNPIEKIDPDGLSAQTITSAGMFMNPGKIGKIPVKIFKSPIIQYPIIGYKVGNTLGNMFYDILNPTDPGPWLDPSGNPEPNPWWWPVNPPYAPITCVNGTCTFGTTTTVGTEDPNELVGPSGYGAKGFVVSSNLLSYRINFENSSNAAAPAQQVNIVDQLSTNYDWTTFNVSEVGFGNLIVSLPPGVTYFATNVPYIYLGTNFQVQIQVGMHPSSGQVYANFQSIDPTTSLPPPVNIGFLPPEDGTGIGMGHVTYTIRAKGGLADGTQLNNVALISFNQQPSIATDQVDDENPAAGTDPTKTCLITLDSTPPVSSVSPLPAQSQLLQVPVSWSGLDNTNGPGIASFNVFVSDNGSAWTMWQSATTATNATFQGQPHHSFGFTSQAIDNAGLVEPQHTTADATTTIVANPQFQFTVTPASTNLSTNATFGYTVTVKNVGTLNLNNVTMSNAMPAGIDLDYVEYGHGSCDIEDTYLLWSLGNMNTNFSATMTVIATAGANGVWTNSFAVADSQGAASASAVQVLYIGVTPPVLLNIALTNNQVLLSWPSSAGNFGLQETTNLALPTSWSTVANTPATNGNSITVTIPVTSTNQFFRLRSP